MGRAAGGWSAGGQHLSVYYRSVSVDVCLSVQSPHDLLVYLPIFSHLFCVRLFICSSLYLFICSSVHLFVYSSTQLSIHLCVYLSTCIFIFLSTCPSVYPHIYSYVR